MSLKKTAMAWAWKPIPLRKSIRELFEAITKGYGTVFKEGIIGLTGSIFIVLKVGGIAGIFQTLTQH